MTVDNAHTDCEPNVTKQKYTTDQATFSYINSHLGKPYGLPKYPDLAGRDSLALDDTFKEHLNVGGDLGGQSSPSLTPSGVVEQSSPTFVRDMFVLAVTPTGCDIVCNSLLIMSP